MLHPSILPDIQRALADASLDGWLIFDFQGVNPVAAGFLGWEGFTSRRHFALVPRTGVPIALSHSIELGAWRRWPTEWSLQSYSTWQELDEALRRMVGGKRIAMEYSPGGAVPYLDRVPAGMLEMVHRAGAAVVSSGELVTRFYAVLDAPLIASHRRAAEAIAEIARTGMAMAGERAAAGRPMFEHELHDWIMERFAAERLTPEHGPIVAAGSNAANPHYLPSHERPRPIERGELLLVDLFAHEPGGLNADQTWVASLGTPPARAREIWLAVRDARDAAIDALREAVGRGESPPASSIDRAARAVITSRGFGEYFTHRTGHSIDARSLHGAGPHLDDFETRDDRRLIPGVAFSIEPGIYVPGEIGVRSEVNAIRTEVDLIVTPVEYQRELLIV
jgi:Xaa-Pro dipeptidase